MKQDSKLKRIGGYLHRILPVRDARGNVIDHVIKPVMVELRPRDIFQIIIGASILAIPVAYTEEAWNLATELPLGNLLILSFIAILFEIVFVYFNFYRSEFKGNEGQFSLRIIAIFFLSHLIVALILTVIQKAPWQTDLLLAIKRVLIVGFPSVMSASVSDVVK